MDIERLSLLQAGEAIQHETRGREGAFEDLYSRFRLGDLIAEAVGFLGQPSARDQRRKQKQRSKRPAAKWDHHTRNLLMKSALEACLPPTRSSTWVIQAKS